MSRRKASAGPSPWSWENELKEGQGHRCVSQGSGRLMFGMKRESKQAVGVSEGSTR